MAEYTFYDPTTGNITVNLSCSEYELQFNLRSGEQHIEGWYLPYYYKIENGAPVERPWPDGVARIPGA